MSPRPDANQHAETVRVAAVLPEGFGEALLASIVFVTAIDTSVHPRDVAHALATATAWPTDEEWAAEGPRLERVVGNARATYRVGSIQLEMKRPQG